jgi:hypothetical protein
MRCVATALRRYFKRAMAAAARCAKHFTFAPCCRDAVASALRFAKRCHATRHARTYVCLPATPRHYATPDCQISFIDFQTFLRYFLQRFFISPVSSSLYIFAISPSFQLIAAFISHFAIAAAMPPPRHYFIFQLH